MIVETQQHAEADQQRRERVDLHNRCDGLVYAASRTLEEFAARIDLGDRSQLEAALEKARVALREEDLERLRVAVEDLSTLTYRVTEKLYAPTG